MINFADTRVGQPVDETRTERLDRIQSEVDGHLIRAVREVARLQKDLPTLLSTREIGIHIMSSVRKAQN